jgi:hypothetical protein
MILNEICAKGNLSEYREEVGEIISKIEHTGFRVSCWDNSVQSVTEWGSKLVRVGMKDNTGSKFHVIWDMLHEYGHVVDGQPTSQNPDYDREFSAWENARHTLIEIPRLMEFKDEFEAYREFCLKTHKLGH